MVANGIPYFHNDPGVGRVRIRVKKFMCAGDLPPFDHPHIYIDMGDDNEIVCPYCGTLFAYDPDLMAISEPAQSAFRPEAVRPPVPAPGDISVVSALPQPEFAAPPQPQPQPQVNARRAMSIEATSAG